MYFLDFGHSFGGGNRGSTATRSVCSTRAGISRLSRLQDVSKQGFILTSIRSGWKSSVIMKSSPKSWLKSSYFKAEILFFVFLLQIKRLSRVSCQQLQLGQNLGLEIQIFVFIVGIQVFLKILEGNFVALLVLTIVLCLVLDGVVGQMHNFAGYIVQTEFS